MLGHPANSHKQVHMKNAMLAGLGEGQGWSGSDAILPHLGPPGHATEKRGLPVLDALRPEIHQGLSSFSVGENP